VQAAIPPQFGGQLDDAVTEAAGALDELGEIARGIHPAVLTERGLAPALKTLARRSAVPVDLQVHVEQRLPEPVEVSAYYVIAEALSNAAKHARASTVSVLTEVSGDVLLLTVRDDGAGGAGFTRGTGLAGLKDRVEALGGRIFLDSPRGAGTSLRVELPLTPSSAASLPLFQCRLRRRADAEYLQLQGQFAQRMPRGGVKIIGFPVRDLADSELVRADADCRDQHHLAADGTVSDGEPVACGQVRWRTAGSDDRTGSPQFLRRGDPLDLPDDRLRTARTAGNGQRGTAKGQMSCGQPGEFWRLVPARCGYQDGSAGSGPREDDLLGGFANEPVPAAEPPPT
jgi:hypothetical protein